MTQNTLKSWLCVALAAILAISCASTRSSDPAPPAPSESFRSYIGPAEWEQPLRDECRRQLRVVGQDPNLVTLYHVEAKRLEPVGENGDGPYAPLPRPWINGNVHAYFTGKQGVDKLEFGFAAYIDTVPDTWTISHEVAHSTLVVHYGIGGHPDEFTLDGRNWKISQLTLEGTRWPELVDSVTPDFIWQPRGKQFVDMVNGVMYVGGKPVATIAE